MWELGPKLFLFWPFKHMLKCFRLIENWPSEKSFYGEFIQKNWDVLENEDKDARHQSMSLQTKRM